MTYTADAFSTSNSSETREELASRPETCPTKHLCLELPGALSLDAPSSGSFSLDKHHTFPRACICSSRCSTCRHERCFRTSAPRLSYVLQM